MAEEEAKKVEPETCLENPVAEAEVAEEKAIVAVPVPPPKAEEKAEDECKALAVIEKPLADEEKKAEYSTDRDAVLARVESEKTLSLITAWEESEKSKAENKAHKKITAVGEWEINKKASLEAELKKIEEELEKKKAEYIEKTKHRIALVHKAAEEKRVAIESRRGEDLRKTEELAAKHRSCGTTPKKLLSFF